MPITANDLKLSNLFSLEGKVAVVTGAGSGIGQALALELGLTGELADAPQAAEIDRAKAQLKAHLFMARESPLSRAEQAAGQLFLFDRLFPTTELAEAIEAVGADDFRRLGQRMLGGGQAVAVLGPKKAGAAASAFAKALAA